jgi:membrane protease YdiL (CAAX protease family)
VPGRFNETAAGWIFVVSYLAGVLLTAFMSASGSPHQDSLAIFLLYVVVGQVAFNVLPAVVWFRYKKIPIKKAFRLNKVSPRVLILSLLIYAISQIVLLFFHQLTEMVSIALGAPYATSHYPVADSIGALLILIISIGIIPPICEELLFRGALLTGYARGGVWFGAGMTAALFALFHDNPYRIAELFASAWVAAVIVLRAQSIYPGMLVHLLTNITFVCVSYFQGGDMLEGLTSPQGPELQTVVLTGIASVAAFLVCRWLWLKIEPAGQPVAGGGHALRIRNRPVWLIPIMLSVAVFLVKFVSLNWG